MSDGRVIDSRYLGGAGRPTLLAGVYERPGGYDVEVTRRGYITWRQTHIQIGHDECHVWMVRLVANMTRTGPRRAP